MSPHLRAELQGCQQASPSSWNSPFSISNLVEALQTSVSADAGVDGAHTPPNSMHGLLIVAVGNREGGHGAGCVRVVACAGLVLGPAPCSWCAGASKHGGKDRGPPDTEEEHRRLAGGEELRARAAIGASCSHSEGEDACADEGEGAEGARRPSMVRFEEREDEGNSDERRRRKAMRDKQTMRAREFAKVTVEETVMAVAPGFKGSGLTRALCRSRWLLASALGATHVTSSWPESGVSALHTSAHAAREKLGYVYRADGRYELALKGSTC